MAERATVLLTTGDPALLPTVAARLPHVRLAVLNAGREPDVGPGPLWCFVDWLLPQTSGLEMCKRLREWQSTAHAHITIVLDEDDSDARRRSLRAGADDYMLGPMSEETLVARLMQYEGSSTRLHAGSRIGLGALAIDLAAQSARWHGKVLALRPAEFRLLIHFLQHPDQVFSRASLISRLGRQDATVDERTVDVWIGRLRRALSAQGVPDHLRTVRAMGYVLDSDGFIDPGSAPGRE